MLEKFLKKSSWTDIIISLLFILFGIMLIARPEVITSMISLVLAGICIILGVLRLINYFTSKDNYSLAIAVTAIITGIVILFCSDVILSVFRIIIAIWILYSGIMNLQTAIVWKEFKSRLWLFSLILAILTILAGIYILVNSGALMQTIGIIITAYGLINIIESFIFIKKIDNYLD